MKNGKPGKMAVQRHGQYDGTFFGSVKWPELLIGHKEIARFFRISPGTATNWLAQGRLPTVKDTRGRWMVTRRVLEEWMLKGGTGLRHRRGDKVPGEDEMAREERREMGLPPDAPIRGDRPLPMSDLVAQGKTPEPPSGKTPEPPQGKLPEPGSGWWER